MYQFLHQFKLSHQISKRILSTNFPPFRLCYRLFKRLKWKKTKVINGNVFHIHLENGIGLVNFISDYEPWLDKLFAALITEDSGYVVDVGANVGQTLLKVMGQHRSAPYLAIEPNAQCVQYLEKLCQDNQLNQVKVIPTALSNHTGSTELLVRFDDDLLATTSPDFRKFTNYSSSVSVPVVKGDDLIQELGISNISLIKVDVEGGECLVLAGLCETIKKDQPIVLCEILPLISKSEEVERFRKESAQQLINTVHQLDYILLNIQTKELVSNIEALSSSLESANYLLVHQSRKEEMIKVLTKIQL